MKFVWLIAPFQICCDGRFGQAVVVVQKRCCPFFMWPKCAMFGEGLFPPWTESLTAAELSVLVH